MKSDSSSPVDTEEAGASPDLGPTSAGTPPRRAVNLHRRYHALLRHSRLMAAAFWVAMGYFLYWAAPWFPGGLSEEDYTQRVTLTLVLAALCVGLGVGSLALRQRLRGTREVLLAWTEVYDETTGLYNRRYFFDRLALECERARRQGTTFSLILLRIEHSSGHGRGPSSSTLQRLGAVLNRTMRSNDLVALLGANELAVVAMGVPRKMSPQVVSRLKDALEGCLVDSGHRLSLGVGVATYGGRSRDPGALLRSARRSLGGKPTSHDETDIAEDAVA